MKSQKSHLACTCIFRYLIIFKDLSLSLLEALRKLLLKGSQGPVPRSDTLVANIFPTTLPIRRRELCISSLTNPCGHFASHTGCSFAKTKSLERSHTKIQDHEFYFKGSWMAEFRTSRKKEQKLFSELFIWSLMTSDFASA